MSQVKLFNQFVLKGNNEDDCWEWIGETTSKGYGATSLVVGKLTGAHRVAWYLSSGEMPGEMQVLHKCDNRICVNPDHLFLGTNQDNMDDMVAKGRQYSKLTPESVCEIRLGERSDKYWAEKLGVSENAIREARLGITWKHIPGKHPGFPDQRIKLTPVLVWAIRNSDRSAWSWSKELGVAERTIYNARNGITWKNVPS